MDVQGKKLAVWDNRHGGVWIGYFCYSCKKDTIELLDENDRIIDRISSCDIKNNKPMIEIFVTIPYDVSHFTLRDACK